MLLLLDALIPCDYTTVVIIRAYSNTGPDVWIWWTLLLVSDKTQVIGKRKWANLMCSMGEISWSHVCPPQMRIHHHVILNTWKRNTASWSCAVWTHVRPPLMSMRHHIILNTTVTWSCARQGPVYWRRQRLRVTYWFMYLSFIAIPHNL